MTDQIADMLIRVKNAYMARKKTVVVGASKMNAALANVLLDNKYITEINKGEEKGHPALVLTLNYIDDVPAMTQVRRVSKPGRRMYIASSKIPAVLKGFGINILSTSQGVMTGVQAREKGLGGEILCEIW
jgi:small subunit ribosomal protein S8